MRNTAIQLAAMMTVSLAFTGCGDANSPAARTKALIGRWRPPEADGEIIEFRADGSWIGAWSDGSRESRGTWLIESDALVFRTEKVRGVAAPAGTVVNYRIEAIEKEMLYLKMPTGDVGEWKRVKPRP